MERKRWHIVILVVFHVIVYFAGITPLLLKAWGAEDNDFTMVYMNAVKNFLNNPTTLYDSPDPRMRLRTLPAVALYYAIFYLISPTPTGGWLVCSTWMLLWNVCSVYYIVKITQLEQFQVIQTRGFLKDPRVLSLLYLCYFWLSGEYYSGPPNVIAGFFIILGIYFFMQSKDHLGFLAWGISMTFKLYSVFLILFFLLKSKKRDVWKNLLFTALSMLPNLLMFLVWPSLLFSFVNDNITTSLVTAISIFPSGSLARLLSFVFPVPFLTIALVVFIIILPITILIFLKYGKNMNILDQAVLAFTCGIVVFPDFYPGHSVIFWGLFLLWLASKNDRIDGTIKFVYFVILFYIIPSVYNKLYAIPFLVLLISFLVMIVRPSGRNPERLLKIDHTGSWLLLPVYVISVVDIALVFTYLAPVG